MFTTLPVGPKWVVWNRLYAACFISCSICRWLRLRWSEYRSTLINCQDTFGTCPKGRLRKYSGPVLSSPGPLSNCHIPVRRPTGSKLFINCREQRFGSVAHDVFSFRGFALCGITAHMIALADRTLATAMPRYSTCLRALNGNCSCYADHNSTVTGLLMQA